MTARSRVAVVTGGTTGIGLETTRQLLAAGHRVAVFSQGEENVVSARATLGKDFGPDRIFARTVNIVDPTAVAAFFAELEKRWSQPTILICNAGISPKGPNGSLPFADIPLHEWNEVIAVNLTGPMLCCQAVLPGMVEAGFGRIVFVGSVAARGRPRIAGTSYVASKAALSGLARALIGPYAPHGITINLVAPGRIITDLAGSPDSSANKDALKRIPSQRLGVPEDVAAIVAFLASDVSQFINGATIDINGGEVVAP